MLLQQMITGNQQIPCFQRFQDIVPVGITIKDRVQRRCKPLDLSYPVKPDRNGSDNQCRTDFTSIEQYSNGLNRLAQTHIICETATDAPFREPPQPLKSLEGTTG